MHSEELNEFKINELCSELQKLTYSIDRICDRIIKLERESFESSIRKKVINAVFFLYPMIITVMTFYSVEDHKSIENIYKDTKSLFELLASNDSD